MPEPTPFPAPPAPNPAPDLAPDLAARRARRLAMFDLLAELNMEAAKIAAEQIRAREPGHPENPHLALSRATRSVTHVITVESRFLAGEPAPAPAAAPAPKTRLPAAADPRRRPLREALHALTQSEPDRGVRTQLRRTIDQRIDEELAADPDLEIPIFEILMAIAEEFGLRIDVSRLSDELLGMAPSPTAHFTGPDRPPLWAPAYKPAHPPGPEPPNIP